MTDHVLLRSDTSSFNIVLIPLCPLTLQYSLSIAEAQEKFILLKKTQVDISKMQWVKAGSKIFRSENKEKANYAAIISESFNYNHSLKE